MRKNTFFRNTILATCLVVLLANPVQAAGLQSSTIYTGFVNLLNDLTNALMLVCPIAGTVAALYFMIRRSMADEQDGKMWTKRITTAIICGVSGMLVSGLISLLTSYFV